MSSPYTTFPRSPGYVRCDGASSACTGNVVGRRPPGSRSPNSTSVMASPPSWPGYHACNTAGTSSAQGMAVGEPALTTTTVSGLAATTRRMRSSWSPGRCMLTRSLPSASHSPLDPATTMTRSALAASATARSMRSGSPGGLQPTTAAADAKRPTGRIFEHDLVGPASHKHNVFRHFRAPATVERPARRLRSPVVQDDIAVHEQAAQARAHERKPMLARDFGVECARCAHRKLAANAGYRLTQPTQLHAARRLCQHRRALEAGIGEVVNGDIAAQA